MDRRSSSSSSTSSSSASELPFKDGEKDTENATGEKLKYPKSVFFIVVNEFCERFCYYGMRTVLALYMRNILNFDEDLSTVLYHTFLMLCYFTPVLGAVIADNFIGKFKTILYLSIFYAVGCIVLAVAAIPHTIPQVEFSMVGLMIIAFGTGGIKPCVSSFGGDQFVRPQQDKQLEQYFSVFYFAINAGSLISTFVTPILREDVHCFGDDSCYSLAFGLPAILMVVAIVVFVLGKPMYKILLPQGNIMGDFVKCIGRAIKRKITVRGEKHDHWMDYAGDKYDKQLIEDTKRVLSVGFLFLPLPVFWALYDQQGSRWTFQATRMNGDLGGGFVLKPDQVQIVNPLLILILVPIFESLIYPLFKKCNLLTPLQRIGCGLVLCGLSFVVSGLVEISLQPTYEKIPEPGQMQLNFINSLPCSVNVSYTVGGTPYPPMRLNETFRGNATEFLPAEKMVEAEAFLDSCTGINVLEPNWKGDLGFPQEENGFSVLITVRENKLVLTRMLGPARLSKSDVGQPMIGFLVNLNDEMIEDSTFVLKRDKYTSDEFFYNFSSANTAGLDNIVQTDVLDVEIGTLDIYWRRGEKPEELIGKAENLIQGGVYTIIVQQPLNATAGNTNEEKTFTAQIEVVSANTVSVAWLLPQYFVVTTGEVMFSVTGLSFAFTQAPASMKSVVTAMWQLVVAFGNLIDIIVASTSSSMSQADEFFLFAGIMGAAAIIFTFMALPYKYVETDEEKKDREAAEEKKKAEAENKAFDSKE